MLIVSDWSSPEEEKELFLLSIFSVSGKSRQRERERNGQRPKRERGPNSKSQHIFPFPLQGCLCNVRLPRLTIEREKSISGWSQREQFCAFLPNRGKRWEGSLTSLRAQRGKNRNSLDVAARGRTVLYSVRERNPIFVAGGEERRSVHREYHSHTPNAQTAREREQF